jgi:hypothetical protein
MFSEVYGKTEEEENPKLRAINASMENKTLPETKIATVASSLKITSLFPKSCFREVSFC